jgi:hypothetical protein
MAAKTNLCRASVFLYPARPVLPVRWFELEASGAAILVAEPQPNAHWSRQLKKCTSHYLRLNEKNKVSLQIK